MTVSTYDQTRQISQILLKAEPLIDVPVIRGVVEKALRHLPEDERSSFPVDQLVGELEMSFSVWIGVEASLEDNTDHEAWLPQAKDTIDWRYWRRYQRYLEEELAWSSITVRSLDRFVDAVLEKLEDPGRSGSWDRRGLVAGHVQSGKTSNFTGLICKAVDAGYKLVVVLAGIHKSLRSQTQARLDEGFLGYDSEKNEIAGPRRVIGVGQLDPGCPPVNTITTSADNGDFRRHVARNFHIAPDTRLLFVIKKNATVLRNLLGWIENYATHRDTGGRKFVKDVPILVIDDEADNASVDTKSGAIDEDGSPDPEHDPAVINGLLRKLLRFFARSAYVGYTATPFANIYIADAAWTEELGEDLFPKSFIINLPAPSNYIGPMQVFGLAGLTGEGSDPLPLYTTIEDYLDSPVPKLPPGQPRPKDWGTGQGWMPPKHRKDHVPRFHGEERVPDSLREAIRAFVLARAGRISRGQTNHHNSMLIHASRFTDVQRRVYDQVEKELAALQDGIEAWNGRSTEPVISELQSLWEKSFQPVVDILTDADLKLIRWADVRPHLKNAAAGIRVKQVNGSAGDILDYREAEKTGLSVIAIGGDKLARGLTLEGLTVSYFLRASKMYDTLMQMGRWFGYRPGYTDLCRLYTSPELVEWYVHVSRANEELREMFDDMARKKLRPLDYGLRVRAHPDGLLITASVKMRNGTRVSLSYDGSISETVVFAAAQSAANLKAMESFVAELGSPTTEGKSDTVVWGRVPVERVVALLAELRVPEEGPHKVKPSLLREFIRKHEAEGELRSWTVALISNRTASAADIVSVANRGIGMITRKVLSHDSEGFSIKRLVSPADERYGLSEAQISEALRMTRLSFQNDAGRGRFKNKKMTADSIMTPTGTALRSVRPKDEGLLLLYMVKPVVKDSVSGEEKPLEGITSPVPAFALSFPSETTTTMVDYVVNNVYWDQEYANA